MHQKKSLTKSTNVSTQTKSEKSEYARPSPQCQNFFRNWLTPSNPLPLLVADITSEQKNRGGNLKKI